METQRNDETIPEPVKPEPAPDIPGPSKPKPDNSPKPEIPMPSTTPLSNPTTTPGIDRTHIMPEHDTRDRPEESPAPLEFPEVGNETKPEIDENTPPTANNKLGFY